MTTSNLVDALEAVLLGDASKIALLKDIPQIQLQQAWIASSRPTITAEAAKSVLRALRSDRISLTDALLWAKLVRSGYMSSGLGRVRPLPFEWKLTDELEIAEITLAVDGFADLDLPLVREALERLL